MVGRAKIDPSSDTAYGIEVSSLRVVVDTNVLVSGLRSRLGSAFRLLERIGKSDFEIAISVPLLMEYEDVLHRATALAPQDIRLLLGFWCSVCHRQKIFFLWRPQLRDPKDDMVLELAVASRAKVIVTYNLRDFAGAESFGIEALSPKDFLDRLKEREHGDLEPANS